MKPLRFFKHHAWQGGFALAELFWAIAIGLVIIVTTMSVITHHLALLRMHSGYLRARLAAFREMEQVKSLPWPATYPSMTDFTPTMIADDPVLDELLPNAEGRTYICQYHPWRPAGMSRIHQIIVAVTLDTTTNPLPTASGYCYSALLTPNPQIIQLTTLIDEYSPWYP